MLGTVELVKKWKMLTKLVISNGECGANGKVNAKKYKSRKQDHIGWG